MKESIIKYCKQLALALLVTAVMGLCVVGIARFYFKKTCPVYTVQEEISGEGRYVRFVDGFGNVRTFIQYPGEEPITAYYLRSSDPETGDMLELVHNGETTLFDDVKEYFIIRCN